MLTITNKLGTGVVKRGPRRILTLVACVGLTAGITACTTDPTKLSCKDLNSNPAILNAMAKAAISPNNPKFSAVFDPAGSQAAALQNSGVTLDESALTNEFKNQVQAICATAGSGTQPYQSALGNTESFAQTGNRTPAPATGTTTVEPSQNSNASNNTPSSNPGSGGSSPGSSSSGGGGSSQGSGSSGPPASAASSGSSNSGPVDNGSGGSQSSGSQGGSSSSSQGSGSPTDNGSSGSGSSGSGSGSSGSGSSGSSGSSSSGNGNFGLPPCAGNLGSGSNPGCGSGGQ